MSEGTASPIHFWLPAVAGSTGGIQAYLRSLIQAYSAERPDVKTEVFIKNDPRAPVFLHTPNLTSHCYGVWPEGLLRTVVFAVQLLWAAWRRRPALIIVGHLNFVPLAVWTRRWLGIPFWGIVYGVEVTETKGAAKAALLKQAGRVISISRFTRDALIKSHGLPPELFSILPTTVDDRRFRPGPKPDFLREKFGLAADRRIILTVCRLSRSEIYKGYDQVLRALPTVRRDVPQAHYLLAGDGDDLPRIRQLVTDLKLEDVVTLAGFVRDEDLVAYYQLCDIFAMPSRKEGFGIVFLEALACGRPVVAGNCDGSVDALLDGELGVLVDPLDEAAIASALISLLKGLHPHPLVYQSEELRRRILNAYGPQQFAATLAGILAEFLPGKLRNTPQ